MPIWPKKAGQYEAKKIFSHIKMGKGILTFGDIEIEGNQS